MPPFTVNLFSVKRRPAGRNQCHLALAALALLAWAPFSNALVILQYHHISDDTPAATSTRPALFEEHLELIAASGLKVVDLETVTDRLRNQQAPPDDAVLITFDDSYPSIYESAYPLLKARNWPFVIFVNTGPVGSSSHFLNWEQIIEMANNGAAIANHSVKHPHFARREPGAELAPWRAAVQKELLKAERDITLHTGQQHRVLAFPYGEFDQSLLELLSDLGFLGMSQASGAVRGQDALAMPRFPMGGRYGATSNFELKLQSLPMPLEETALQDESGAELIDGVLPRSVTRPVLILELADKALANGLACYASGQTDAISKHIDGNTVTVQADRPLPAGRSRYNCTARAASGRFHWFSQPFLRRGADGAYPPES